MGSGVIKLCKQGWVLLLDLLLGQRVECDVEEEISWAVGSVSHLIKPGCVECKGPLNTHIYKAFYRKYNKH